MTRRIVFRKVYPTSAGMGGVDSLYRRLIKVSEPALGVSIINLRIMQENRTSSNGLGGGGDGGQRSDDNLTALSKASGGKWQRGIYCFDKY